MATNPQPYLTNPKSIAEIGEAIYHEKYQAEYERLYPGQYVAINVETKDVYVGTTPEGAFQKGHDASPMGLFHLIRIGHRGVFRVSRTSSAHADWIYR